MKFRFDCKYKEMLTKLWFNDMTKSTRMEDCCASWIGENELRIVVAVHIQSKVTLGSAQSCLKTVFKKDRGSIIINNSAQVLIFITEVVLCLMYVIHTYENQYGRVINPRDFMYPHISEIIH